MNNRKGDPPVGVPDDENPEWTEADFAAARPFKEVFPKTHAAIKRHRGRRLAPKKLLVSLRLDALAVERFKQTGPGWQTRIDEIVKAAASKLGGGINEN